MTTSLSDNGPSRTVAGSSAKEMKDNEHREPPHRAWEKLGT